MKYKFGIRTETTPRIKCHNTAGLPLLCLQYKQERENRKVTLLDVQSYTWSDNKVRELATVCLPWQHWTKALVLFDDVDISAFHSCVVVVVVVVVVVDLWQSRSEWHLLLSVCVLVCC
jgi:hypothetical protein